MVERPTVFLTYMFGNEFIYDYLFGSEQSISWECLLGLVSVAPSQLEHVDLVYRPVDLHGNDEVGVVDRLEIEKGIK